MFVYRTSLVKLIMLMALLGTFVSAGDENATRSESNIQAKEAKKIIGAVEMVKISPPQVSYKARIDTGATTTSIDARDITPFERDGKKWVKFTMVKGKKTFDLERPVVRVALIKRHGSEAQERYVVKVRVTVAETTQLINVTLSDRKGYEYPVLIGRNFLKDYFIVDVSSEYLLQKSKK